MRSLPRNLKWKSRNSVPCGAQGQRPASFGLLKAKLCFALLTAQAVIRLCPFVLVILSAVEESLIKIPSATFCQRQKISRLKSEHIALFYNISQIPKGSISRSPQGEHNFFPCHSERSAAKSNESYSKFFPCHSGTECNGVIESYRLDKFLKTYKKQEKSTFFRN